MQKGELLFYVSENGRVRLEVLIWEETVWLSQKQMAELFWVQVPAISKHLKNIFEEWELNEKVVVSFLENTTQHGFLADKTQTNQVKYYNLDAIISLGYRINSQQATHFRIWATKTLKDYILKGFVLDDERLKNGQYFGKDYFDELLARIREIRASERRFYQKITDIYATSEDYNKDAAITREFFAEVQNKLLFAITQQTAPELIYSRADADALHMGLQTWKAEKKWGKIIKTDIVVSKNYLKEDELQKLNLLVSQLLDFAEFQVQQRKVMYMQDRVTKINDFLKLNSVEILQNKWSVSKEQAVEKAEWEFEKYRVIQDQQFMSDFDQFVATTRKLRK